MSQGNDGRNREAEKGGEEYCRGWRLVERKMLNDLVIILKGRIKEYVIIYQ